LTLKAAYQQADADTILRVVLEAGELREARWKPAQHAHPVVSKDHQRLEEAV